MKKDAMLFSLILILCFAISGGVLSLIFSQFLNFGEEGVTSKKMAPVVQPVVQEVATTPTECPVLFHPPSPNDAPADLRDAVLLGHNILMDTQKYAARYVGNKLNCKNCHFEAGRSKDGLSLVGVAATYPQYKRRENYSVDLVTRTNDCFERSMNGKPLPPDSKEMSAIITYYHWISKDLPIYASISWLGLKPIKAARPSDFQKGEQIYAQQCSACHGMDGLGTPIAPPLWGTDSFNDGSGMARLENLAAFADHFMPRGNPDLTVDQALDVAAFVTRQPRPHFTPKGS
jgi:thiosulfate dehydrogenase